MYARMETAPRAIQPGCLPFVSYKTSKEESKYPNEIIVLRMRALGSVEESEANGLLRPIDWISLALKLKIL